MVVNESSLRFVAEDRETERGDEILGTLLEKEKREIEFFLKKKKMLLDILECIDFIMSFK